MERPTLMLVTAGGRTSGYGLFVKNSRLYYVYNYIGIDRTVIESSELVPEGKSTLSMRFTKTGQFEGDAETFINGESVGKTLIPQTVPATFSIEETFDVGEDTGSPIIENGYAVPFRSEGLEKLKAELDELTNVTRPEVAQRIHDAKEYGDVTENAEYEDAKNEQAFVEGRIQTLTAIIKNAVLIDEKHSRTYVQIGSTVTIQGEAGKEKYTIVGAAEAAPDQGRISNESPVGRALLGKKKGEEITVSVPAGDSTYTIVSIR